MNLLEENIPDVYGSERSVEIPFTCLAIQVYCKKGEEVLEVGGVPTRNEVYNPIWEAITNSKCLYSVCDFRGGKYRGDFVTYNFEDKKFKSILFISSLEHFPQCTEGDMLFRKGEDRKGFQKALDLLEEGGHIILTVPFGKHIWQEYHQNYNLEGIINLSRGSTIVESYTYSLFESSKEWCRTDPTLMENILYTDKAFGVGCFILKKNYVS